MKTRNVIQAFQETLMDLPIADREERLQLFTEKLDALEDAQARRPADSGLDQGWGEFAGSGVQAEDEPYRQDRQASHPARSRPQASRTMRPSLILLIALAILAVVEAVTIGVLLIFGGSKPDPVDPSPAPSGIVAGPDETVPSPADTVPEPSQSTVPPSPSASASAGPAGTGNPEDGPAVSGGNTGEDPVPSGGGSESTPAPSGGGSEISPAPSGEVPENSAGQSPDETDASNAPKNVSGTAPAE